MKKVVHIFWSLTFGGIETMLVNIVNAQVQSNVDVYVIIINDMYEKSLLDAIDKRVKIRFVNRERHSRSPFFICRLNNLLSKIEPDVIHLHDSSIYNYLFFSYRKKTCCTLHAMPYGKVRKNTSILRLLPLALVDFLFKQPGNLQSIDRIPRVLSISNKVKALLFDKVGVNSIVIHNGIMIDSFKQRATDYDGGQFRIVQVSRLDHEKKGQDLLIKAIGNMRNRDNVDVDFIGDGESFDYLNQMVHDLRLDDQIHFLAKKDQAYIAEHLCDYHLFVQPSRFEGFGLTVAEAMAAKLPVLVTDDQGPAEVTCGNKYGWTFMNGRVDDLSEKLDYIIDHYREANAKSIEALRYVADNYDVKTTAKRYLDIYESL
jgi:glycosyltransferase involved in cell wall biosynthesis